MSSGPARGAPPPKQHGLTSFPVPSAEEDMQHDEVDEEVHKDEDVSIKVVQTPGFQCSIQATAAFRMPARTLYKQVITHPDNAAIFRHMKRCAYRRVLSDADGRRVVKVAHEATWRFMLLHGTFTTKLVVEEDDRALTMRFDLDPDSKGGLMRKFHGMWTIRPHPADPQHASLSTLDQDLALGIFMPPPFDRVLKRISCNQVRAIFEDVKREADKVARGKPSLRPWEEVGLEEMGSERDLARLEDADAAGLKMAGLKLVDDQPAAEAATEAAAPAATDAAAAQQPPGSSGGGGGGGGGGEAVA